MSSIIGVDSTYANPMAFSGFSFQGQHSTASSTSFNNFANNTEAYSTSFSNFANNTENAKFMDFTDYSEYSGVEIDYIESLTIDGQYKEFVDSYSFEGNIRSFRESLLADMGIGQNLNYVV